MRKVYLISPMLLLCIALNAQKSTIAKGAQVIVGKLIKVADPFKKDPNWKDIKVRDENGIIGKDEQHENDEYRPVAKYPNLTNDRDGAVQSKNGENNSIATQAGFNGLGYTQLCPADPSLAVGPGHVVQMINGGSGAYFQVWNKTGTSLLARTYLDAITGKGGLGDPIVLYDQLADRFVLTEFVNKKETRADGFVFAVSRTADPTGLWNVYFYSTSSFPDYPKFSVWHDAYYAKTNNFKGQTYTGASVFAFDKTAMLNGAATASMQTVALGTANKFFSMCPVGLSGTTTAPAGTGGLYAYINDNSWSGSATDSVGLVEFDVNFANAALSTVSTIQNFAVSAYNLGSSRAPQPNGGQGLDMLRNRVMNQPQYRNFGSSASIVLAHVADNASNAGAIRWYELKNTGTWSVNQQSTYSPDNTFRYLPSININAAGDIGLSYNVSSTSVFPSIRATGRLAGDPLNTMTLAEKTLKAGTSVSSCANRYGDYNHLVVDPSDNSTFWMTAMYNSATSWSTYINSFNVGTGFVGAERRPTNINAAMQDNINTLKASMYPNPVKKFLYLTLDNLSTESSISISDLSGKLIMERKANGGTNKIDVAHLASGVYMIKVVNADKSFTDKFVKE